MMTYLRTLAVTSLMLLTTAAFGHGNESKPANPNGGETVKAGAYNLELVVTDTAIDLYVSDDHNKALDTQEASVEAVILADKKKSKVVLSYKQTNQMTVEGSYTQAKKMKVILYLQMPGKKKISARFNPKK
ncbi:MAG: hypothetical protein V7739_15545 [Motiliproteus sp.]